MTPSRVRCGRGSRPVRSFVALYPEGAVSVARPKRETSFDYLAEASLHRPKNSGEDFYSSATPRVQLLKHLSTREAPGDHPGSYTPSRISDDLRLKASLSAGPSVGHVARGSDPQLTSVCIELPFDHSFRKIPR